jgi:endoglucanase
MSRSLALITLAGVGVAFALAVPARAAASAVPSTHEYGLPHCPLDEVAPQPGADYRAVDPHSPNPLVGSRWFVDPREPAYRQWLQHLRNGQEHRAALVQKIALMPKFRWFGTWTIDRGQELNYELLPYINRAQCCKWDGKRWSCPEPPSIPLLTVMRHQGKECHRRYTAGGPAEDERARRWYDSFARTVWPFRIAIGFEPDSLGTLECVAPHRRGARLRLLRYGVAVLSKLPNATIYLEAGASDWESARVTARRLRYIGIRKVRGFMLNATHYDWTANNIRYGLKVSRLTGGKPFIVSTSFNGRGPVHLRARVRGRLRRLNVWCHPLRRGLGPLPTTNTGNRKVDAFMWVGRPGYSAGSCNGGPLPIGRWWPERALMFGKYAADWRRAPPGTYQGLFRRYSPAQLGYCGLACT